MGRTSLLLLRGQLLPVDRHAITEGHPQFGLLLRRHLLPALLNVGEGGIRDGVLMTDLLLLTAGGGDGSGGLVEAWRARGLSTEGRGKEAGRAEGSGGRETEHGGSAGGGGGVEM